MAASGSPSQREIERAAEAFALAAHALRLRILCELARESPQSPSRMAPLIGTDLSTVSYHFRCLSRAGAVRLHGTKQRRGALEHYYVLGPLGTRLVGLVDGAGSSR